jgi:hypothetical protein
MLSPAYRKIDPEDMNLFCVTNSLDQTVRIIEEAWEAMERARLAQVGLPSGDLTGEGTLIGKPTSTYPPNNSNNQG